MPDPRDEQRTPTPPTSQTLAAALAAWQQVAHAGEFVSPRYRIAYTDWPAIPSTQPSQPPTRPRTVLLIHGLADERRSFAMLQQALAERGMRSVSYELAGRQGDGAHLGRYQHEDFSRDALALAEHLGLEEWDVVGCSFGSTVTLRLMALAPSRVRRVVLQGGFAVRRLNWIESGLKTVARFLPGTLGQLPRRREVAQQFDLPQLQGCPPEIFEFLLACGGQTPCRTAAHRAECLRRIDLRASLPTLPQPVRLLGGVSDPIVPRADEAVLEAGLINVHRIEFAPGGHYPQYAAPADMAQAIAEFCLG